MDNRYRDYLSGQHRWDAMSPDEEIIDDPVVACPRCERVYTPSLRAWLGICDYCAARDYLDEYISEGDDDINA